MKPLTNLLMKTLASNQNNYRLTDLTPLDQLPEHVQNEVRGYCSSKGDRAHHAAGVLLHAFISKGVPIAVVGCNDLDVLIKKDALILPEGPFSVRGHRMSKTIWSQLTGFLIEHKVIQILKPQQGRSPAVIEVIHEDWLQFINGKATDEMRLSAVGAAK